MAFAQFDAEDAERQRHRKITLASAGPSRDKPKAVKRATRKAKKSSKQKVDSDTVHIDVLPFAS